MVYQLVIIVFNSVMSIVLRLQNWHADLLLMQKIISDIKCFVITMAIIIMITIINDYV